MRLYVLLFVCVCASADDYVEDVTESCCTHGEKYALNSSSSGVCSSLPLPEDIQPEQENDCRTAAASCCQDQFRQKEECTDGMKYAASKRCSVPNSDTGKTCCEECSFGTLTGESQGKDACGAPPDTDMPPSSFLRKTSYHKCCLEAASKPETTTQKATTPAPVRQTCKPGSCGHQCDDTDGVIRCLCNNGYRLQRDQKTCKDINECAEAIDDLCHDEGYVCHNTPGSFKCVPLKKRDVSMSCPAGFKRNLINQVCDDINECQLPRPPCPKYLCENTIGGYKCAGKPGKPTAEDGVTEAESASTPAPKNEICPSGFRAGPGDECVDIDECNEHVDDCQRLSQHCINTHGSFFCQDHVSKRCAPGFKVNTATGICEDIDECEESSEVCKRNQVCVNLPGAYDCKSKISTLPKLTTKTCQEGTRMRVGGSTCDDIDECREGTHLCDQFQNCINTFGGHECRCKSGFELDSASGSCVDIDECSLKLDNCGPGQHCLNVLGSFTCTRQAPTSSTTPPAYEYEYYDSDEVNTTSDNEILPEKPTPVLPPKPTPPKPTTPKPTTPKPTTPKPTTTKPTTTQRPTLPPYYRPRPTQYNPLPTANPAPWNPYTNRPPTTPRPDRPSRPEYPNPGGVDGGNGVNDNKPVKPKEDDLDFDINELHCLYGYEKNEKGECVDTNECDRNVCGALEQCRNTPGSFVCDCIAGFRRDANRYCVAIPPPPTTSTTATTTSTTTRRPTTTSTTEPPRPEWSPPPRPRLPPSQPRPPPCELGYAFDSNRGRCVDVDECATNRHTCAPNERCVNVDGGFNCEKTTYVSPPRPRPGGGETNVITVGAQYGQRGPRFMRSSFSRLPNSGAIVASCPWGYQQTPDKRCFDIDECARNISECGPRQRCENFYGGYSCQCPAGHRLMGKSECADVDECLYGTPCSYTSTCINTVGSYRCECRSGFRNAPSNDKVCEDVDECETPGICHQGCTNSWGSYRCNCDRGYRLDTDNRSCVDVDECAEFAAARSRGRLCGGECVNEPGSYRCSCPPGYRLSEDGHSCIDIDECETGEASCARSSDPGQVCQNTRGSYHCHTISCPDGYRLEGKHRCARIQRSCPMSDLGCLHRPSTYSYNFITFVANIYIPTGRVDLFTMHGPSWSDSFVSFEMSLLSAKAARGVRPADINCFDMRPSGNTCVISLLCSLEGPQVDELELTMSLYQRGQFAGSAVARLIVIVSQYEY